MANAIVIPLFNDRERDEEIEEILAELLAMHFHYDPVYTDRLPAELHPAGNK